MKCVGIICEYNPFHNGHLYHINKVKELYPGYLIILVLNGNFTQRGDVSLIDKWKKTEVALNYVDLVVELAFVFGTQSADIFAKGAIDILKALNVDAVVFGSECNDVSKLEKFAKIQNSEEYNIEVKKYLDNGYNYPTSLSKAIYSICGDTVSSSNDLLALSYVKNLIDSGIKYISIKRTNDYLDDSLNGDIASGSGLRKALNDGKDIKNYLPICSFKSLDNLHFIDDYFNFLKYKIISEDISKYQTVDEGIENRIKKCIHESENMEQLINSIKTKRYTYNKISRMLIHILTGFTKEEAIKYSKTTYIRVLGFNNDGQKYLNNIKKNCKYPILTKFKKDFDGLYIENRVSDIYNLINGDGVREFEHKIVKKNDIQ